MGLEPSNKASGCLSRPRFTSDFDTVLWIDVSGAQDEYAEAVSDWCNFHDLLPNKSWSMLVRILRGPILKSQCYGNAKHIVKSVSKQNICSESGAPHIVSAVHKRDHLSFLSDVFVNFNGLRTAKHHNKNIVKNFKSKFEAQISKINVNGAGSTAESLVARM